MSRTHRFAVVLAIASGVGLACRREEPKPAPASKPAEPAARSAVPLVPEPEDSAVHLGPPPPSAARAQREQAVISLLRGQQPSERFPEIATDDGGAVRPELREELSPHKETVVKPRGLGSL